MVGMEVRHEDLSELRQADRRAQQLPLSPFAAVEEQPLAAPPQEECRRRPLRSRDGA